ncbi:MAG TPA: hypothetical protein VLH18_04525 [Candidatus Limnocylindrales bacterium]|nr:hypothetical protein [Candidatus Limnocylindrales bacterium]
MAARTHPNQIDQTLTNAAKNGLRLAGFDIKDVTPDRPLPPDGLKILADLWNYGASVPEIMQELNLSEARASGDLVYLELKGKVQGFVACMFEGSRRDRDDCVTK